jgi:hypothetical protein
MTSDVSNTFMVTEARLESFSREMQYRIGRYSSEPKLRDSRLGLSCVNRRGSRWDQR